MSESSTMPEALLERIEHKLDTVPTPSPLYGFFWGTLFASCVAVFIWYRFQTALKISGERKKAREITQALNHLDANDLKTVLGQITLPSWLTAPDYERVRWLNRVVNQLFPHGARYAESWAKSNVDTLLKENSPSWIRSIKLNKAHVGIIPPSITGIKVYSEDDLENDDSSIIIELDTTWQSRAELSLTIQPVPKINIPILHQFYVIDKFLNYLTSFLKVKVSVEKASFTGKVQVSLTPLMSAPPIIGAVQVSLYQVPKFNFELKLWNGNAAILPGLESWLFGLIADALRQYALPNKFMIPLVPEEQLAGDRPKGVLEVRVIEAENVPKMDLLSLSDPYVRLFTRAGNELKTQVIDNTKQPVWDEKFMLLVHYPRAQTITFILMDYDVFDQDDEIGRVEIPIIDLMRTKNGDVIDEWYDVKRPGRERRRNSNNGQTKSGEAAGAKVVRTVAEGGRHVMGRAFSPFLPAHKDQKQDRKRCRLHVRMAYIEFPKEDLNKMNKAYLSPGSTSQIASHLSPEVQRVAKGGLLHIRIRKASDLDFSNKSFILGGWKHKVKVRVIFAGQKKSTQIMGGRQPVYNFDSELEFIIDSEQAEKSKFIRLECWDVNWKNAFLGCVEMDFRSVQQHRVMIEHMELQGAKQGSIEARFEWIGLLSENALQR